MSTPPPVAVMKHVVRFRRRSRGPIRPSWDVDFEAWARFLHHYAKRSTALPLALQRRMLGIAPRSSLVRRMRFESVTAGGVPAEWFRATGADEGRVLLYFHGGGYSLGSIDSHRELVSRLCVASGATGLSVDYRLAPEHRFPAQLDDARAAYRWLLATGVPASRVVVAGDSAGGGLALSLLVALRDAGAPLPAGAFLVSPWVDLEATGDTIEENARYDYICRETLRVTARRFVREADLRNPLASPLHADLHGLPPLLVHAGACEALLDDARRITARARAAGVDVTLEIEDDMIHVFHMFAGFCEPAKRAIDRAGAFIRDRLAGVDANGVRRAASPGGAADPRRGE